MATRAASLSGFLLFFCDVSRNVTQYVYFLPRGTHMKGSGMVVGNFELNLLRTPTWAQDQVTCKPPSLHVFPFGRHLNNPTNQRIILVSQNVVVLFNKDVIIIKLLMIALLLMKTALFFGGNAFSKMSKTSLVGRGASMTASDFPDY